VFACIQCIDDDLCVAGVVGTNVYQIDIRIGVEAEYYPAHFEALLQLLADYPCEYMIMGQHFIKNELDGTYNGSPSDDEVALIHYVSQTLEGLETGKFSYVAHPDLFYWTGDAACYQREMTRLCRGVKALDLPLEINLLGLYDGRNYPKEEFWQIAGTVGNKVVLGCDAHSPEALNRPETAQKGRELAARYGLQILETVELRPL